MFDKNLDDEFKSAKRYFKIERKRFVASIWRQQKTSFNGWQTVNNSRLNASPFHQLLCNHTRQNQRAINDGTNEIFTGTRRLMSHKSKW